MEKEVLRNDLTSMQGDVYTHPQILSFLLIMATGEGTNKDIQTSPRNKDITAYLRNGKILKNVAGAKVREGSGGASRLP